MPRRGGERTASGSQAPGRVGGRREEPPHGKLTFIAGMAAGYVLGARAGRKRYEQIRRTSGKVWHSGPVQKQVFNAKEAARTKAAPVVADMVADAARATGEKLRSSRTVEAEAIETGTPSTPRRPTGTSADRLRRRPLGRRHLADRRRRLSPSAQAIAVGSTTQLVSGFVRTGAPATPGAAPPAALRPAWPVPVLRNRRPVHRAL